MFLFRELYLLTGLIRLPVGYTSINLLITPDFELVIFTGSLVPKNNIELNLIENFLPYFGFTSIVS